jgi:peroxiredoxin
MNSQLQQGDKFPSITLSLVTGEVITIPEEMPSRYTIILFYRGHW